MKTRQPPIKVLICMLLAMLICSISILKAQDYLISFAGEGGSTTVDSVIVQNLTQGTILKMNGNDALHLKGVVSISETDINDETGKITLYPNPMKDYARLKFLLPETGETIITLHDISGKVIVQTRDQLLKGEHTYSIQGLKEGIYLATVSSGRFSSGGKLISSGSLTNGIKIALESSEISKEKRTDLKGVQAEAVMQYNTGDQLKFKGKSGIYSTIITDIPTESKTITYEFIACTDGDGNNYPVIFIGSSKGTNAITDPKQGIGTQTWMGENLKATKFNDNTDIPNVTDGILWSNLLYTPGAAYCWYKNDINNKEVYGAMYNWFAVNTGKLCPSGWHVPTLTDWTKLIEYMGGESVAGGKLKETGTVHWNSPNTGATDIKGFTALPGGARTDDGGEFRELSKSGNFWSAGSTGDFNASSFMMYHTVEMINYRNPSKAWGISVRCLLN